MGAKKVLVFNNDRQFLTSFDSADKAADMLNVNKNTIYHAMRKFRKGQTKLPRVNGKYVVYEKDFPDHVLPPHGDLKSNFSVGKKVAKEAANLEDLKKEVTNDDLLARIDAVESKIDSLDHLLQDIREWIFE